MIDPRTFAIVLLLAACGDRDVDAPPTPVAAPVVAASPRPGAGVDLAGPIAPPDRRGPVGVAAVTSAPAPIDLASDRAVIPVSVPVPPIGGSVGFQFGDDRAGWVARLPDTNQLPTVAFGNGKVYVSGGFESVTYYGMDATTGHIDWATTNLEDNGPTAAVYDEGRVIFNTESCTLFALDAVTGKRLWLKRLGDPTLAQTAVADGLIFASHPTDHDGQVLSAYRAKTGAEVWWHWIGSELLAAPVIAGDSVYASTTDGMTFRIERATGKLVWDKPLHATTAPWIAEGEVYLTRRKGRHEQQVVASAATGAIVREQEVAGGAAGDVPAGIAPEVWKSVWEFEGSRPVVERGVRYVAMGGEIHASDAATGAALWQRRYAPGKSADRRSVGSVALAGSEIVIATRDGQLFGLDVDTGYTLWSYAIGHKVMAEPVVAKGWVYAATADGYVVALQVADPTLDGWHMFGGNPRHDGQVEPVPEARGGV